MKKPLSGARWFEAQGRSAFSRGLPMNYMRAVNARLPVWARSAWARGWIQQGSGKQMTNLIVSGFEKEAKDRGLSLRDTVASFLQEAA